MTTITLNKADATGQSNYVSSQAADLASALATLTFGVNSTANGALIAKMNAVNSSFAELQCRLNGSADFLAVADGNAPIANYGGVQKDGGVGCNKNHYND